MRRQWRRRRHGRRVRRRRRRRHKARCGPMQWVVRRLRHPRPIYIRRVRRMVKERRVTRHGRERGGLGRGRRGHVARATRRVPRVRPRRRRQELGRHAGRRRRREQTQWAQRTQLRQRLAGEPRRDHRTICNQDKRHVSYHASRVKSSTPIMKCQICCRNYAKCFRSSFFTQLFIGSLQYPRGQVNMPYS